MSWGREKRGKKAKNGNQCLTMEITKIDSLNKWGIEQSPGPLNDGTMTDDVSFAKYIRFDFR